MDFGGAGAAQHGHNARRGSPAHDAVVNQGDALPAQNLGQRVELQVDAKLALRLVRLNERTPDVAVLDQTLAVGQPGGARKPDRGRRRRVRHRHDEVGRDGILTRQLFAHALSRGVHQLAVHEAVGPSEVDVLERARCPAWRR